MTIDELISPDYRAEQIRLHAGPRAYGERGSKWSDAVDALASAYNCASILDYGCGQGSLAARLLENGCLLCIHQYDPARVGIEASPEPADLVVCTDVLEHVEPDKIEAVFDHLCGLARKVLFLSIALTDTEHRLSDGRSTHLILKPIDWWGKRLTARGWRIAEEPTVSKPEKQWASVWLRC